MEVHHHSHSEGHGKKWVARFWDFFMLFLAVTLGFFVENRREHFVEHQREKVYMRMLRDDLRADMKELKRIDAYRSAREKQLDSLILLLGSKDLKAHASEIYRLADATDGYETFLRNDRTIQQLKAAGGMRMIRRDTVSADIMGYDNFIISEIDWNNRTEASRIDYYKQIRFQLFDAQSLFRVTSGDTATLKTFLNPGPVIINQIAGALFQVKRISQTNRESGLLAKDRAEKLAALIEEEYHLN